VVRDKEEEKKCWPWPVKALTLGHIKIKKERIIKEWPSV
jgi:hypothetical protein